MTPEKTIRETYQRERVERAQRPEALGNLEVWAHAAPIRLAGYEEDLAEPHILQGID